LSNERAQKPRSTPAARIALAVGLVLSAAVVAAGVVVYRWANDPAREVEITAIRAASARPGARSVKDLGCDMALVQTDDDMQAIAESKGRKLGDPIPSGLMVSCLLKADNPKGEPACGDIARTYCRAVREPPKRVFVRVQRQGAEAPVRSCEGVYSAEGELVEAVGFR